MPVTLRPLSYVESGRQRFCGAKCRYALRDRKRHVQRGTRIEATCLRCGGEFDYESATKPRLYCVTCSPVVETGAGNPLTTSGRGTRQGSPRWLEKRGNASLAVAILLSEPAHSPRLHRRNARPVY